jgi:hypothetical protein
MVLLVAAQCVVAGVMSLGAPGKFPTICNHGKYRDREMCVSPRRAITKSTHGYERYHTVMMRDE